MDEEKLQTPADKPGQRKRSTGRIIWGIVKWMLIAVFTLCLFAGGAVFGYVASNLKDDPVRSAAFINEKIHENAETGFVYFNDGTLVGQLRTSEDRRVVDLKDIPQTLIDALIATEDNNFYKHMGIDVNGVTRAVKQKVFNEDIQTGGSTLTQQLARRVFLSLDRTDNRKIKEMLLAIRLERFLTKEEILAAYLNKVPFGNGNTGYNLFGVKAAAKGIFNKDLKDLTLAQCAYIAGLPQLPSAYSAFNGKGLFNEKGFNRAVERQKLVLRRMLEEKKISQAEYEEALAFDIKSSLAPSGRKAYDTYPYLMLEAERSATEALVLQKNPDMTVADLRSKENTELMENAREQLLRGGYKIYLTINKQIYDAMHKVATDKNNFAPDSKTKGMEQIAAVMIDHKTGAILGMIEGRDFYEEQMNFATQMYRQPGSAMKPLAAYLPALEEGKVQPASIIDDSPIILKDGQKGFHIPKNYNGAYNGLVTARNALNRSLNIPALKLFLDDIGIDKAWEFVRKLGITSLQPEDYTAQTGVIGGLSRGVSVEEITNAYGAIPNQGVFNDAYIIKQIVDPKGTVIYQHQSNPTTVFSPQTAYLMQDMLRTVVTDPSGTARALKSEFKPYNKIQIAGKTGTTQNNGDVWFVGFSPDITLGVWAGYDQMINELSVDSRTHARQNWAKIMNAVIELQPERFKTDSFVKPDGIVSMTVSGFSGKLPTELTRSANKLVTDIFNKKFIPTTPDDGIVNMKIISYNGINYLAQDATPGDMVDEKVVVKRTPPLQQLMKDIEAAQEKLPEQDRKPIQSFMPRDADLDAPSLVDPRVDDGHAPAAPQQIQTSMADSKVIITFAQNGEEDVVGYRLYRAMNGSGYQIASSPVLTGQATRFSNFVDAQHGYSYYITAVDVGGHESSPSEVVTVNGGSINAPAVSDTSEATGEDATNATDLTDPVKPNDTNNTNDPSDASDHAHKPADHSNNTSETAIPASPSHVKAKGSSLGMELTWRDVPLAKEYKVYVSKSKNGKYSLLATTTSPRFEYIGTGLSGYYQVTAISASGESSPSEPIQFKE